MTPREFWNGAGELPDGAVHFTNDDGTLHGRPYLRLRAKRALTKWWRLFSVESRRAAIAATVDNDEWLAPRNGVLVSCVCREVVDYLFLNFPAENLYPNLRRSS